MMLSMVSIGEPKSEAEEPLLRCDRVVLLEEREVDRLNEVRRAERDDSVLLNGWNDGERMLMYILGGCYEMLK